MRRMSQKFSATVADHKNVSRKVQLGSDQVQAWTLMIIASTRLGFASHNFYSRRIMA